MPVLQTVSTRTRSDDDTGDDDRRLRRPFTIIPRFTRPPLPSYQVFFQQKAFNSIEKLRTTIVSRSAIIVQTFWRGISCRRAFLIRKGTPEKSKKRRGRRKRKIKE